MKTPTPKDQTARELALTRQLDYIQAMIWAGINDVLSKRGVKITLGEAYEAGSSIKEVLHPQVMELLRNRQTEDVGAEDGASEKPAPQEEVSGKQVDMLRELQFRSAVRLKTISFKNNHSGLDEAGIPSGAYSNTEGDTPIVAIAQSSVFGWLVAYVDDTVIDLVKSYLKTTTEPLKSASNPPSDEELKQKIEEILDTLVPNISGEVAPDNYDNAATQLLYLMKGNK